MSGDTLRLDKWLWYGRFAKTRALAQKLIAHGQVSVNGVPAPKASSLVHPGDTVAVVLGPLRRTVIVRETGERRGPPSEARRLYDEPAPPQCLSWEDAGLPLHRR